jgi:hypothetical protein
VIIDDWEIHAIPERLGRDTARDCGRECGRSRARDCGRDCGRDMAPGLGKSLFCFVMRQRQTFSSVHSSGFAQGGGEKRVLGSDGLRFDLRLAGWVLGTGDGHFVCC